MMAIDAFGSLSNDEFEVFVMPHPHDGFRVRAFEVARILGFRDAPSMARSLPEAEQGYTNSGTPGGDQRILYLTRKGFLRAIGQRQTGRIKDGATRAYVERFQDWVYGDVLPSVLETGTYSVPARREPAAPALPTDYLSALELLVVTERAKRDALVQVAELEPKAAFADGFLAAKGNWSVRQAAHMLDADPGIDIGETRLFRKLRELPWISKDNTPLKHHVDAGRVTSKPAKSWEHPKTGERMAGGLQARLTEKGIFELHGLLGGTAPMVLDPPDDEEAVQLALLPGGAA